MRRVLVTTGNGMFGRALIERLLGEPDIQVRAMVRDRSKFPLTAPNLEVVTADMDDPASLVDPVQGMTHVFLTSPMDDRIAAREMAVTDAARAAGQPHMVVIYGAVRHQGDALDSLHLQSLQHVRDVGLPLTTVSPNSVMETSLLSLADQVPMGVVLGMSGHGKVGLVALADVADVLRAVITGDSYEGQNLECTGPQALDMPQVVAALAAVLGRKLEYLDLPESDFAKMLTEHAGFDDPQRLEIEVLCHLRAWRDGRAATVTDTVAAVTGRPATSVAEWFEQHRAQFSRKPTMAERLGGLAVRAQYRHDVLPAE